MGESLHMLVAPPARARPWQLGAVVSLAFCVLASILLPVPFVGTERAGAQAAALRISEFMAANPGPAVDEDGDTSDWIEIQNTSEQAVFLDGWVLHDSSNSWEMPAVTIAPGAFAMVWASAKDRSDPAAALHTSFKLSADGEYLALVDPAGVVATEFAPSYPAQSSGRSFGFAADGVAGFMAVPTPGFTNSAIASPTAAAPTAAIGNSFQDAGFTEQLTTATANATIRYTLDGSEPTAASSTAINGDVPIPANTPVTTLRAVAIAAGHEPSEISTFTYVDAVAAAGTVGGDALVANGIESLSVVSVTTDSGVDPTSAEIYEGARVDYIDLQGPGFSAGVGVKLSGYSSLRSSPKKTMRLNFSSAYGPSELEYPLFADRGNEYFEPATKFDQLELRGYSLDSFWSGQGYYVSNEFARSVTLDLGSLSSHGKPVIYFVNGSMRGLYQLRERINEDWLAEYLGGNGSDYESWFVDDVLRTEDLNSGSGEIYAAIDSATSYQQVKNIADARSLINSALALWFYSTYTEKEWRLLGPTDPDRPGGFHFIPNDIDLAFSSRYAPGRSESFRDYLNVFDDDPEFQQILWDQAAFAFCEGGPMSPDLMHERLDELSAEIEAAIPAEVAAFNWGSVAKWSQDMVLAHSRIDSGGATTRAQWTAKGWHNGCQRAPQVDAPTALLAKVGQAIDFTLDAVDPDGDTITFASSSLPDGVELDAATGRISGAPVVEGSIASTIRATDSNGRWLETPIVWDVIAGTNGPAPFQLNELNGVDNSGRWNGSDPAFPESTDNGGDWFELLVLEDNTDLRGWSVELWDRDRKSNLYKQTETFTFADDERLASTPAGLLVTISEDIPEDPIFDQINDWHINATASSELPSELLVAAGRSNFDTSANGIQLVVRAPDGTASGLLVGETRSWMQVHRPLDGNRILTTCAEGAIDRVTAYAAEALTSTFGEPNQCGGSTQDLSDLRVIVWPGDTDCDLDITNTDVQGLLDYLSGKSKSAPCPIGQGLVNIGAADVNGDDNVNLLDALILANCAAEQVDVCR